MDANHNLARLGGRFAGVALVVAVALCLNACIGLSGSRDPVTSYVSEMEAYGTPLCIIDTTNGAILKVAQFTLVPMATDRNLNALRYLTFEVPNHAVDEWNTVQRLSPEQELDSHRVAPSSFVGSRAFEYLVERGYVHYSHRGWFSGVPPRDPAFLSDSLDPTRIVLRGTELIVHPDGRRELGASVSATTSMLVRRRVREDAYCREAYVSFCEMDLSPLIAALSTLPRGMEGSERQTALRLAVYEGDDPDANRMYCEVLWARSLDGSDSDEVIRPSESLSGVQLLPGRHVLVEFLPHVSERRANDYLHGTASPAPIDGPDWLVREAAMLRQLPPRHSEDLPPVAMEMFNLNNRRAHGRFHADGTRSESEPSTRDLIVQLERTGLNDGEPAPESIPSGRQVLVWFDEHMSIIDHDNYTWDDLWNLVQVASESQLERQRLSAFGVDQLEQRLLYSASRQAPNSRLVHIVITRTPKGFFVSKLGADVCAPIPEAFVRTHPQFFSWE